MCSVKIQSIFYLRRIEPTDYYIIQYLTCILLLFLVSLDYVIYFKKAY